MKTVDILGCCILRDIFRVADVEQGYKVNKFYQFISPVSIVEESPKTLRLVQDELSMFEWSNFIKRNICSDFNKNVPAVYSESPAEYLIIDLCELRFRNIAVTIDGTERFYVTKTKYTDAVLQSIDSFPQLKNAVIEDAILLDDEAVFECLNKYVSFLKSIYPEKNIIMVRNHGYWKGVDDKQKQIFEYHNGSLLMLRERLNKYYDYVERLCPNINVIRMPDNCLCYAQHLWGRDPLHFYDEYYTYLYKAVDLICNNASDATQRIEELRLMYSEYFKLLEAQKRLEFFAEQFQVSNNLVESPRFEDLSKWTVSCSKQSCFNNENTLICDDENGQTCWAILSQKISPELLANQQITISVKYQTYGNSLLNACIRTKDDAGKYSYLIFNQYASDNSTTVSFTTGVLPEISKLNDASLLIYLNRSKEKAKILEVKLEIGNKSTLF